MKIIVDAMGGDNAPEAVVLGAIKAKKELAVDIVLVGQKQAIMGVAGADLSGIEIYEADDIITMDDDPSTAVRRKPNSSMAVALNLVNEGYGEAMVSAGSTGALLTGATLLVKRIRGVRRAALAPVVPNGAEGFLLMDSGANAECTLEYMLQFAHMGSLYAKTMMGFPNPRVALLNIGTEEHKGTSLHLETYEALERAHKAGKINFVGNIEASRALFQEAEVIVADGFSGNILLKSLEGTAKFLLGKMKTDVFMKNLPNKMAAMVVKSDMQNLKDVLDPDRVGGTALIGISKPVIKAHGSSNDLAIFNAVRQAKAYAQSGFIDEVKEYLAKENA